MEARLRFEEYLKRRFGQSSTLKHYHSDLMIFEGFVGNRQPESITAADIDAFIEQQSGLGVNPVSINRRLSVLHSFFEYLAAEVPERVWPNPVVGRRHRLKTGTRLPRDIADDKVSDLFVVMESERDQAIFGLMVGAGLRVGEVATLRLEAIEEGAVSERLSKLRVLGKGNKERMVWLSASLWKTLQAWIALRGPQSTDYLFVNKDGQPISVAGIQYLLKQYSRLANVSVSCHRLRHTFARRLAEHGLPVDSLARLLGHNQLQTTQRYIDGADPSVRNDFETAMGHLEKAASPVQSSPSPSSLPSRSGTRREQAPLSQLKRLRKRARELPPWLFEVLEAYLVWRWPTWRSQTAYSLGRDMLLGVRRAWDWLAAHRDIQGWQTFRRADLEAWLVARAATGVSSSTLHGDLVQLRSLFRFAETRSYDIDPGLFRVRPPKKNVPLPRYLPEDVYRRLEASILAATQTDSYAARFDRAWFLALAHTGVRISELLDWRLEDLNLAANVATVRGAKADRDRIVYLTPPLRSALEQYLSVRPQVKGEDHVFLAQRCPPTDQVIRRRLAAYGQQVGIAVTPHQLRHTLATRLINQGMPIASLRKLLGHQDLSTTQIYAHIYDETLYRQFQAAMASLEAIEVKDWPQIQAIPAPVRPLGNLRGA